MTSYVTRSSFVRRNRIVYLSSTCRRRRRSALAGNFEDRSVFGSLRCVYEDGHYDTGVMLRTKLAWTENSLFTATRVYTFIIIIIIIIQMDC